MKCAILAVDIGTTNVKCVVATRDMRVLSDSGSEYRTQSSGIAYHEQDPEDWWVHTKAAIAEALRKAGVLPLNVAAIAVSSQAPTMLPLDREGRAVYPALIWMDRRGDAQCRQMERDLGAEFIYETTGNVSDPFYTFGELLWFKENLPDRYDQTDCVLQANGYINFRLTGERTIDRAHASITQCFDVDRGDWSDAMLSAYEIPRSIFPRVVDADEVIGGVSALAARETGIPPGTPVLGGSVDGAAAALEGGVSHSGAAVEMSGTSSVLLVGTNVKHTSPNLTYMYSAIRGQHLLLGCMSSTGGALKWFRDNVYADKSEESYAKMDREIERDRPAPTPLIFLPYLAGERAPIWDVHAKGAFLGINFETKQADLLRAMQEGAAFALQDNIAEVRRAGAVIRTLRAVGGSTRSDIWMRIKASVTNLPIEIPRSNLGAPGGLLALLSSRLGEYASVQEASDALVKIDRVIEPVASWVPWYQEQFELFKQYYQQTKQSFERADRMRL